MQGPMTNLINKITSKQMKPNLTIPKTGQTVKVAVKISEGDKERIQNFEGLVIKTQGTGTTKTITVRKESYGVGVERTFKVHSPSVADITILKTGKVRRSRIYYMRDRKGKTARLKEVLNTTK